MINSLEGKFRNFREQHQAEIEAVTAKHEKQAESLRKQIEHLQEVAKNSLNDQDKLSEAHTYWNKKVDSLNEELEATKQKYDIFLHEKERSHAETMDKMMKDFDTEHRHFQDQLAMLRNEHDNELRQMQTDFDEESASLKQQNAALKSKLDDTANQLAAKDAQSGEETAVLTTNYDKKIEAMLADHEEKIEALRKQQETDHAVRVAGWEAKLRKADDAYSRKIERLEQQHLEDLANSAADMEDLKKKLAEYEGTEGHYRMRLEDEKEKRRNAVRKFQLEREKRLLLEQQYATTEETQE